MYNENRLKLGCQMHSLHISVFFSFPFMAGHYLYDLMPIVVCCCNMTELSFKTHTWNTVGKHGKSYCKKSVKDERNIAGGFMRGSSVLNGTNGWG